MTEERFQVLMDINLLKETKLYLSFLQVTGIKFALGGT